MFYFSSDYEDETELVEYEVTPVFHYDAPGRMIRVNHSNWSDEIVQHHPTGDKARRKGGGSDLGGSNGPLIPKGDAKFSSPVVTVIFGSEGNVGGERVEADMESVEKVTNTEMNTVEALSMGLARMQRKQSSTTSSRRQDAKSTVEGQGQAITPEDSSQESGATSHNEDPSETDDTSEAGAGSQDSVEIEEDEILWQKRHEGEVYQKRAKGKPTDDTVIIRLTFSVNGSLFDPVKNDSLRKIIEKK
jgi:hypothetical protein